MILLAVFFVLLLAYSLVSARVARTVLTAPLLFTAAGMAAMLLHPGLPKRENELSVLLGVSEIGLVLLLFTEASRVDLALLRSIRGLPARLLGPGMLLTILLGALAALVVFDRLTVWQAGILEAILAPTDAGLGHVVVNSPLVPAKVRQALNVEAGLNDGLSVPFLLFFMALAEGGAGGESESLARLIVEQLGIGALIGVVVGLGGGQLLAWASRSRSVDKCFEPLAVVSLPLLCLIVSEETGASMFIAAFVAGLAAQTRFKGVGAHSAEFAEGWGQMINLSVFFLFGILVVRAWPGFSAAHLLYAVLSLTVVRMLPVAVSLAGTRLDPATTVFIGWFGPRGLASIVLGLVYLQHQASEHAAKDPTISMAVMATVLLSIFAHGVSALPGMRLYAARVSRMGTDAPERPGAASKEAP